MRDKRPNEQTVKIEPLSQWKLEAEFRKKKFFLDAFPYRYIYGENRNMNIGDRLVWEWGEPGKAWKWSITRPLQTALSSYLGRALPYLPIYLPTYLVGITYLHTYLTTYRPACISTYIPTYTSKLQGNLHTLWANFSDLVMIKIHIFVGTFGLGQL